MKLSGKQILVTGGAGFIGSHLTDLLLRRGCRVRVLDNFATGKPENLASHSHTPRFQLVEGTVLDSVLVHQALEGVDVVFHLACLGVRHSLLHPIDNHRVNAEGSLIVARAAVDRMVSRYVHCSSSEVYGTARSVPMTEEHPRHPSTVYGASKLAGESYAAATLASSGLPVVVVRPFNAFGPRSHHEGLAGEVIPKSVVRALSGNPPVIFGNGEQTRDYTYVTDLARALVIAAQCDQAVGQVFNVGSGREITIRRLAETITRLVSGSAGELHLMKRRPGDVDRLCADASRFKGLTGWAPEVNLEQGLEQTVDWFHNHPSGIGSMAAEEVARNWEGVG